MKKDWCTLTADDRPASIRDRLIDNTLRVLVVAPHPDDFDAVGVTLRLFARNGNPLEAIVACTGSGVEDSYAPGLTLDSKARLRECEQRNSARFFGLPEAGLTFLRLTNDASDQMVDVPANLDRLERVIEQKAPDILFLPHGNDTNSAHRAMYALVRQIVLRARLAVALLLIRDPKNISMRMDLYMPFGETEAVWKAELLRFHDTQHQRNLNTRGRGFDVRILNSNWQTARELSLSEPYAEAFEVEIVDGSS